MSHHKNILASYYHNCTQVFMKSTRYFCWTLTELEFSRQTFKNKPLVSNFIKILPVEAEIFYEDGQTDMTKLIIASRFSTSHHFTFFPSRALRCLQPTLTGRTSGHCLMGTFGDVHFLFSRCPVPALNVPCCRDITGLY
jgi:hypothetical protein